MTEPLPDPATLDSIARTRIINEARTAMSSGREFSEDHLRFLLSLLRLERQVATGRSGARSTAAKPQVVPSSVADL